MAKVIYDKGVLDFKERIEKTFDEDMTLEQILDDMGCHVDCSVEINGVIPDKVELDRKFKDSDIVRVRTPLNGSSEESGKLLQTVGLIVGIVLTAYGFPQIGAAVISATSLVGGLIAARGIKKPPIAERTSGEQAANIFNLSSATNEVRKGEPMQLLLGSHRMVPDMGSQPYSIFARGGTSVDTTVRLEDSLEINKLFGGPILPASWISNNIFNQWNWVAPMITPTTWWNYPVRTLTNFNSAAYIASARVTSSGGGADYSDFVNFSRRDAHLFNRLPLTPDISGYAPTLIEHFDPLDPLVSWNGGPFVSTLEHLQWAVMSQWRHSMWHQSPGTSDLTKPDIGTNQNLENVATATYFPAPSEYLEFYLYLCGFELGKDLDPEIADADKAALLGGTPTQVAFYRNLYGKKDHAFPDNTKSWFHAQMAEGMAFDKDEQWSYTPKPNLVFDNWISSSPAVRKQKLDSFYYDINQLSGTISIPAEFPKTISILDEPRIQQVRHIMHKGLGDIDFSDRRIGDTKLEHIFGEYHLQNTEDATSWPIPTAEFHSNVKIVEGGDLINENSGAFSGAQGTSNGDPLNLINWIARETPDNCYKIEINIEGRAFETNDDGTNSVNGANFEIQGKLATDALYGPLTSSYYIGSNKADPIRETLTYTLPPGRHNIRIRKKSKDETDSRKIAEFKLVSFNMHVVDPYEYTSENREGLRLEATGGFNGRTENYSMMGEAKCWVFYPEHIVFDFDLGINVTIPDTWKWEKTRNPSWWFLYYCRGGHINESADGTLLYPYSPTVGWVNSADHVGNIERSFGAGLKDDEIDIDKIKEWAVFCDDNTLYCDVIIRSDESSHDILQRIANTGRGSVSYYNSQTSVVYEDPDEPVSGMFGMSNILKGSFGINYAVEDPVYKIIGRYADRDENWITKDVEAIVPNSIVDNKSIEEVVLDGITDQSRAQREVNILAARQAYQRRTYSWKVGQEGLTVRRGQKVYLSHDVTCYDQSGRIYGVTVVDDLVTEIETNVCLEETTSIMIRFLNGDIEAFDATQSGSKLILSAGIPLNKFPSVLDQEGTDNVLSDYPGSMIEDLVFFAGPKATPGKAVRILTVEPDDEIYSFKITAIEEDPIIFGHEYDTGLIPSESSFERVKAKVVSAGYEKLSGNKYKIYWELEGATGAYVNQKIGAAVTTLTSEGQYSHMNDCGVFEFMPDGVYNLSIEPLVFGAPYSKTPYSLTIRT